MEIDLIQVKGKKQPEAVFAVLGRADTDQDPRSKELRTLNAQMLASFRKQQWDAALGLIARCRAAGNGRCAADLRPLFEQKDAEPFNGADDCGGHAAGSRTVLWRRTGACRRRSSPL